MTPNAKDDPLVASTLEGLPMAATAGSNPVVEPPATLSKRERDRRSAQAMEDNERWFDKHEADLLREHPEWRGWWLAIAHCTTAKIVGVSECRLTALEEGIRSPELIAAASQVQMHPGSVMTMILLGEDPFDF